MAGPGAHAAVRPLQHGRRAAARAAQEGAEPPVPKNQFDKFVDLADKAALTADMLIDLAPAPKAAQP